MPFEDLESLVYTNDQGNKVAPEKPFWWMIQHVLKHYHLYHISERDPIGDDWVSITAQEYQDYWMSAAYAETHKASMPIAPGSSNSTTPCPRDSIYKFKKGIKRNTMAFIIYKDKKQWDNWHHSTVAQARTQDGFEILNGTYVPNLGPDKDLFDEKQKFMYAVFEQVLQTDMGKALVHSHDTNFDAQIIFQDLLNYSIWSTKSSLDTAKILQYVTSVKLDEHIWKGTSQSFVLHWHDQLRKYDTLIPASECFSETIKHVLLENAIGLVDDLRAIKTTADHNKTTTGRSLT
jgi:hypothetical protein